MSIINQVPDGKDPFSVCLISTDCTTTSGIAHRVLAVSYTHLNVESLEKVQPKDLTAGEIGVRLGTTWIPEDVVEDFTFELLGTPWHCQRRIHIRYSKVTGEWNVSEKSIDRSNIRAYNTYGTGRINACLLYTSRCV